jgi:propanediol dehydratase small subunit
MAQLDPRSDYPIGTERRDLVETPSGLTLDDLTLENLREKRLPHDDLRATAETLRRQAAIADAAGRRALGANLERAAELTNVPNDVILELYSDLRPGRCNGTDLEGWAERLEKEFEAPRVAAFVRQAREAYEAKGIVR